MWTTRGRCWPPRASGASVGGPRRAARRRSRRGGRVRGVATGVAARHLARARRARSWTGSLAIDESGGGFVDGDTSMNEYSFDAASLAAGAGLVASRPPCAPAPTAPRSASCARPDITPRRRSSMGFCLFNSIGITAAALVAAGERVAIVDFDAHHGNGTQDAFYESDQVLFVSLHQYPWYPGTGRVDEAGRGRGVGLHGQHPVRRGNEWRRVSPRVRRGRAGRRSSASRPRGSSCRRASTATGSIRWHSSD